MAEKKNGFGSLDEATSRMVASLTPKEMEILQRRFVKYRVVCPVCGWITFKSDSELAMQAPHASRTRSVLEQKVDCSGTFEKKPGAQ